MLNIFNLIKLIKINLKMSKLILIILLYFNLNISKTFINCQLFTTMDKTKLYRIYSDILTSPNKNGNNTVFNNKNGGLNTGNGATTEKLSVKHYSNSKINSYLANIHKNNWFEHNNQPTIITKTNIQNQNVEHEEPFENENENDDNKYTRKTISDVNKLININNDNDNNWGKKTNNWKTSNDNYQTNDNWEKPNDNFKLNDDWKESLNDNWKPNNNWNTYRENWTPKADDSKWSVISNDNFHVISSTEQTKIIDNTKYNKNKNTIKKKNEDFINDNENEYWNRNTNNKQWNNDIENKLSTNIISNYVTQPDIQQQNKQYSTIYKQNNNNNDVNKNNNWNTPRNMYSYSEWLTPTSLPSSPIPSIASTTYSTIKTKKHTHPEAEKLSTIVPPIIDFNYDSRLENNLNKYNKKRNSLYSGINSYGVINEDVIVNINNNPKNNYDNKYNNRNNNNLHNIIKDQFDIPSNIQSFDPYSDYQQEISTSSSYNPYSSTDNYISSTTNHPYYNNDNNNYIASTSNPYFNNNQNIYKNNIQRYKNFAEPETIIENKYQSTLKNHFDNTINLYESQYKKTKFIPTIPTNNFNNNNENKINNINLELPSSKIKFQISSSEKTPSIIIENYHLPTTTENYDNTFSNTNNLYNNKKIKKSVLNYENQNIRNDLELPGNYDYTPNSNIQDVSFTTPTHTYSSNIPLIEIGNNGNNYQNNTFSTSSSDIYDVPHEVKPEKKKPHINWCRLKSKRYITDKRCTSLEPVIESVCSDNCIMPMKNRKRSPHSRRKRRKSGGFPWTCVDSHIKWKKIKLRCQDKSIRWYNIKVVNGCDCRQKAPKVHKRITVTDTD